MLKRAIGSDNMQEDKRDVNSKSIFPPVHTVAKQRSVFDDNKYGPGNKPPWALSKTRFPYLIKAVNLETDRDTRKRISSLYHTIP